MKRFLSIILIISIALLCVSCGSKKAKKEPFSTSFECFDTVCSLTVYDNITKADFDKLSKSIIDRCKIYDDNFNKNKKDSITSKLNENKFLRLYDDNLEIMNDSVEYGRKTNGNFDITVSPIVDLWNINGDKFKKPNDNQINNCLKFVDYKQIKFDGDTVQLTKAGSIDLGAIAKGFVSDKIVELLKFANVKSAIIDLGGNIYAYGKKGNGMFNVGIKKPFGKDELSATVKVSNKAVITSGIYQRYKEYKGKIYSHIMNPKTGYPVDNDLNSVTIISDNSTAADAYSTACMVMGLDKGMKFVNKAKDIEAVFIDKDNKLHLSKGLEMKGDEINIK